MSGAQTIGFVGIGNMGWPMAANLVKAGFDVTVCDARPGHAARFVTEVGGNPAADPAAAVTGVASASASGPVSVSDSAPDTIVGSSATTAGSSSGSAVGSIRAMKSGSRASTARAAWPRWKF